MLSDLVEQALADLRRPTLLLSVEGVWRESAAEGVTRAELGEQLPQEGGWASVVLVAPDSAALRRAVSVLPFLGRARTVVCVVRDRRTPAGLRPRRTWPPLRQVVARVGDDGGSVTRVELSKGVPVAEVLVEIARAAGTGPSGPQGIFVAQPRGAVPPPVDTTLRVADSAEQAADPEAKVPPDVWLGPDEPPAEEHPVTGRSIERRDGGIGPLDEGVLDPAGFTRVATGPEIDLPHQDEATEGLVRELHTHRGVRVPPEASPRLVAGLAMAAVPLTAETLDESTTQAIGADLAAALTTTVDLTDPDAREQHARRLSAIATARHASAAWRRTLP